MSKQEAYQSAIDLAVQKLTTIDLAGQCLLAGVPAPIGNTLQIRAFGMDLKFNLPLFEGVYISIDKPISFSDRILVLHYLTGQHDGTYENDLVSYRDFKGGTFYWEAFTNRTTKLLVDSIGNDIDLLRLRLAKFDCVPVDKGDLGVRIHAIGNAFVSLYYWCGDDELKPSAEILFDSSLKTVYSTEDAAVLASRICLGLVR